MNSKWFLKRKTWLKRSKFLAGPAAFFVFFNCALAAYGSAPDWLRTAASASLPKYPEDTNAVVLLDEQITTVNDKGDIKTLYRVAYKILRPEGRERGTVVVYFDSETRLTYLKAWSLPAQGAEYEVKEKEALEASFPGGGILYEDTRYKILQIPAAEPGNVIGYEYERKRRPYILQDAWRFQNDIPVRRARFELRLPKGWEYKTFWMNHAPVNPQPTGDNQWAWEIADLPGIEPERSMPAWQSLAGRMGVTYFSQNGDPQGRSLGSWQEIGPWYAQLTNGRRQATPEIREKVKELTSQAKSPLEKIQALAAFVQRDIRYVAIEIGIGGFQPHPAQDIFSNRYGDCKDNVTLLSTLLGEIGIKSYYVLISTRRGVVTPSFPTALTFDHVILAIRLPEDISDTNLEATLKDEKLGRLLIFDPTDSFTPLGYLPPELQANYGLLVTDEGGELVNLQSIAPAANRLLRSAQFQLGPNGDLAGAVREILWGAPAATRRARLLDLPEVERKKALEDFLSAFLGSLVLMGSSVQGLPEIDRALVVDYQFLAKDYAKTAGNLLLLRPRVLGEKSSDVLEQDKERKYPVEFPGTSSETDIFEIKLPSGYGVEELPPPVEVKCSFAEYRSKVDLVENVLHYQRTYIVKDVRVPMERMEELKKFFRQISLDERSSAILRRVDQPEGKN